MKKIVLFILLKIIEINIIIWIPYLSGLLMNRVIPEDSLFYGNSLLNIWLNGWLYPLVLIIIILMIIIFVDWNWKLTQFIIKYFKETVK